jgi:hypothetical protein
MQSYLMSLVSVTALCIVACDCPTNDSGIPVQADKYRLERDAACAAVDGCNADFMASVRVYEARTKAEVEDQCSNESAWGCYCERVDCRSIILLNPSQLANHYDSNSLHEYVHAAFASQGVETNDHPPVFHEALARANEHLRDALYGD